MNWVPLSMISLTRDTPISDTMHTGFIRMVVFPIGAFEPTALARAFAKGATLGFAAKSLATGRPGFRDERRTASGTPGT